MLNLPEAKLKMRQSANSKLEVFDIIRKKYVSFTPEENVRQQFINYLINIKNFPASLIAVEKGLVINNLKKRFDAVAYNNKGKPIVLIEFKSPEIKINQAVFEQISVYNIKLRVKHLIVSNGIEHYCCKVNFEKGKISFLEDIPFYKELNFIE